MAVSIAQPTVPSWDFRRKTAGSRLVVEVAADHGVSVDRCLAGSGVAPPQLRDPDVLIEAAQELTIVRNVLREVGDIPGLGVETGRRYTIGTLGTWGFALLTGPTGADSLQLGVRYAHLTFAFINASAELDRREGRVVLDGSEIPDDARSFLIERELTKVATLMPFILGPDARIEVATQLPDPRREALRLALPVAVWRGDRDVIAVDRRALDAELPQADAATALALQRECESLLAERHRHGLTAQRIRALLLSSRDARTLTAVASRLNVDQRTVARRLAEEGVTFRELLAEVNQALARDMLTNGGLTVAEVAMRLSYADAAAFSHAFKRWTGSTPGAYRQAHR
jgi:AraC-like DNA-binding protein